MSIQNKRLPNVRKKGISSNQRTTQQRLKKLEKTVEELTLERDLYRKEWLRSLEEIVPYKMTDEEAQSILNENISLESVLKEIEPMLRKSKSA